MATRGEEVRNPRVEVGLGFHRQTVWRAMRDIRQYQKLEICPETVLMPCLISRASTIVGRIEAACPS